MDSAPQLKQRLGLVDATMLVMGSMIGSGVFIVSADIGRQVGSPGLLLMTWLVTALLTLAAALSYGELAAMMPRAGGQYVYLREAFGPLPAFLYGWTLFLVIQTGTVAAVAVAFAKFAAVFVPLDGRGQQFLAIGVLLVLTWVNSRGIESGAAVQNILTFAKTAALLGLIGLGFAVGRSPEAMAANFGSGAFWGTAGWNWDTIRLVGVALVGALFSSDSWNNVTFTAGETRNPARNIPLSLALGVGSVSVLYLAANYVYLTVLPLAAIQNAPQDRVGTAVARAILGEPAAAIMAVAIMISTFGCVNGFLLAGARVHYAMALDGLFFKKLTELDPRTQTPNNALWLQFVWASALTMSGRYGDLLDYVIFASLLFYSLTIAALFVLRARRPEAARPYRAFGYPVVPALYIVLVAVVEGLLLAYKPNYTWPGLLIVLAGVPVYFLRRAKSKLPASGIEVTR